MATPRNVSRSTAAGTKLRAGRFNPTYINLLDQIAATAPGAWFKANINLYSNAWPPVAFREVLKGGPATVISAWSSFAWDDVRMRLELFGGGHANYAGSEVYMWEATSQQWRLAYHTTRSKTVGAESWAEVGSTVAPMSAHTYANQVHLPRLDRMFSFGGATYDTGNSWSVVDASGVKQRPAGPFLLDMALAGQGYVSASTGSNIKRAGTASEGVDIPGANAWSMRDYWLDHPSAATLGQLVSHRNGTVCITEENSHDVIYVTSDNGNAGSPYLFRIELVDSDYHNDIISIVGQGWSNQGTDQQGAYDPHKKLFLHRALVNGTENVIEGWDLNTPGPSNKSFSVSQASFSGPSAAEFVSVMRRTSAIYDERRRCFVLWEFGKSLWELRAPAAAPFTAGWNVKKVATESLPTGPLTPNELATISNGYGVHGKFKRSKNLDVYIGLQHMTDGNIWLYKPTDWLDPRSA